MQKNHLIIIAVAAVVVIAAAAVVLSINGGSSYENIKTTSLPVYGNANEDYLVDQEDVKLINSLIDTDVSDHPYADANGDGKITSEDADIVQKMINGEKTKVRVLDQHIYDNGEVHIAEIEYPLDNVITINPDMLQLTFMFDGDEKVIGYVANRDSYSKTFYKADVNGFTQCLGTTPRELKQTEWENIKNLDSELYNKGEGIGAILAYNDAALGDYKDDIERIGIPIIYIRCTDPIYSIDAAMLLGFLFGPEYSTKAMNYANDCRKAIVDVTEAVEKLSDSERTRFVALCMWKYISQHDSQYTKIGLQAGGIDVPNLPGNGSSPLNDVEAITIYNGKVNYLMNCRTCDCTLVSPVSLFEDSRIDILKKSSEFENMFYVNLSMPTPCRIMYVASVFYPEIVSTNDAHKYFQTMVDKYLSYLNDTVEDGDFNVVQDMTTIVTYQDYIDAKGGSGEEEVVSDIDTRILAEYFYNSMKNDLENYSYAPYALSADNAKETSMVASQGSTYFVKYTLEKNPKEKFEKLKATYDAKIGTEARTTGLIKVLPYSNSNLTECYGYYVNSDITDPTDVRQLGSMKFAGYIDECLVEIQLVKRPAFEMSDLQKIVESAYPAGSDVDAKGWASAIDLNIFKDFAGAPFSIQDGATETSAKIQAADNGSGDRHVSFDSSGSAYSNYSKQKEKFQEKVASYEGTTTQCFVMSAPGYDDAYGYFSDRNQGGFICWMIYFAGMKDGCYIDVCLRIDDQGYTINQANDIVKTILNAEPKN